MKAINSILKVISRPTYLRLVLVFIICLLDGFVGLEYLEARINWAFG